MAAGALLVALPGPGWLAVTGLGIIGFAAAPVFPLLTLTTAERVGAAHADRAIGLQIAGAGLGGALVPTRDRRAARPRGVNVARPGAAGPRLAAPGAVLADPAHLGTPASGDRIGPVPARRCLLRRPPTAQDRTHEQSALIVIDVQESFRQRPSWAAVSNPDIVEHGRPAGRRRPRRAATSSSGCCTPSRAPAAVFDPALGHVRLIDGLDPRAGEPVLHQDLAQRVHHHQPAAAADRARASASSSSAASAPSSAARPPPGSPATSGYEVTFVTDATATFPIAAPRRAAGPAARRDPRRPAHPADRRDHRPHRVRARRPVRHRSRPSRS